MIKINGLTYINSSEAIFGNMIFHDSTLIIPYFNMSIMGNDNEFLKDLRGGYLKYCYLLFENISTITCDYEVSRFLPIPVRECYGGINFFNQKYQEFWINYEKGALLLHEDFEVSMTPWETVRTDLHDFFSNTLIIEKVL